MRQKPIKITDRYKDGWQVIKQYESDKLASNSGDEKKLKKTKVVGRKRKARQESEHIEDKMQKTFHAPPDHQLFHGRLLF